ncbi:MAG: hypothetical protein JSR89_12990 [Proteobacteria bacterium]|nr:hypothetical protein [Pseudomonadota bacterium]
MSMPKKIGLVVLGAIALVAGVVVWKYATVTMTSLVENAWCSTMEKAEVCHFRGYQHFLIWTIIGITNLFILGLLFDRIRDHYSR